MCNQELLSKEIKPLDDASLYEMGCRIRERRLELGLTMEDVAYAAGYETVKSLSRLELGEMRCTIDKLSMLSQILDLSVDYMLFGRNRGCPGDEVEEILLSMDEKHRVWIRDVIGVLIKHPDSGS